MGNHGGSTEVRLYSNQNVPLAQSMSECGMGIAAPQKVPMVEAFGASFILLGSSMGGRHCRLRTAPLVTGIDVYLTELV